MYEWQIVSLEYEIGCQIVRHQYNYVKKSMVLYHITPFLAKNVTGLNFNMKSSTNYLYGNNIINISSIEVSEIESKSCFIFRGRRFLIFLVPFTLTNCYFINILQCLQVFSLLNLEILKILQNENLGK